MNTSAKGDVLHITSILFPTFFSYTRREAEQASMMLLSPSSLEFSMVPTHCFSFHYCLTRLGRKLPTTLAPFSLSLPPTLLDLRFNMASEKGLGVKSAFAFHCIVSATGSYHSRSHLCKLIFKSVKNLFVKQTASTAKVW